MSDRSGCRPSAFPVRLALSASQARRLRRADLLDGGDPLKPKGKPSARNEAAHLRREVHRERLEQQELRDVVASIAETESLEAERMAFLAQSVAEQYADAMGYAADDWRREDLVIDARQEASEEAITDEVRVTLADGTKIRAKRIRNRDGLMNLYQAGHMSRRQLVVLLAYRRLREALTGGGLGSQLADPGRDRKGLSSTNGMVAAGIYRAMQASVLTDIEAEVRKTGLIDLAVLQQVAGDGSALRPFGAGGSDFRSNIKRLIGAAGVCEGHIQASAFRTLLTDLPR